MTNRPLTAAEWAEVAAVIGEPEGSVSAEQFGAIAALVRRLGDAKTAYYEEADDHDRTRQQRDEARQLAEQERDARVYTRSEPVKEPNTAYSSEPRRRTLDEIRARYPLPWEAK